tara:strand:- start:974 stop:2473 length:1500 start_codon:yes stop_codon:yes gene_type:complete
MIKKFLLFITISLSALLIWMIWNMSLFSSKQISIDSIDFLNISRVDSTFIGYDPIKFTENLSEAIKYKTISYSDSSLFEPIHFLSFHKFLERTYPLVFSNLEKRNFSNYSILLKWNGNSESPHNPILLMAHMDVVPVENQDSWTNFPFSGKIDGDYVWGRGAIDDKSSLIAILESLELLLYSGFTPNRDIYIAIGHDEENSGRNGNKLISESLRNEGVYFDMVLDEGSVLTEGIISGVEKPLAVIGIAEKGYVSIELTCNYGSGHSSMPDKETTIGKLSKAIVKIERNSMPSKLTSPVKKFFSFIGPEMSFQNRFLLSNSSFFSASILSKLNEDPITSAMVSTTAAPTIIKGGIKSNVLPSMARAVINYRIRQGDSVNKVLKHVEMIINDKDISVKVLNDDLRAEPSKVSNPESPEFNIIHKTINEIFGDVIVAPGMILATTDSRHYQKIAKNIYRFMPIQMTSDDLSMVHGTNEKISIDSFITMIHFYYQLIKNIHAS